MKLIAALSFLAALPATLALTDADLGTTVSSAIAMIALGGCQQDYPVNQEICTPAYLETAYRLAIANVMKSIDAEIDAEIAEEEQKSTEQKLKLKEDTVDEKLAQFLASIDEDAIQKVEKMDDSISNFAAKVLNIIQTDKNKRNADRDYKSDLDFKTPYQQCLESCADLRKWQCDGFDDITKMQARCRVTEIKKACTENCKRKKKGMRQLVSSDE